MGLWEDLEAEAAKPGPTMTITKAQYAALLRARDLIRWIREQRPAFPDLECCSFAIGSHYSRVEEIDGTVQWVVGGDVVPPHEPVIKPGTGVLMLNWKSVYDAIGAVDERLEEAMLRDHGGESGGTARRRDRGAHPHGTEQPLPARDRGVGP